MKDSVYQLLESIGIWPKSIEDAVSKVIHRAYQTANHLCWFQVVETRDNIDKGKVRRCRSS